MSDDYWPTDSGPNDIVTKACGTCGAITGLRYGLSDNPTDNHEAHRQWHLNLIDLIEMMAKGMAKLPVCNWPNDHSIDLS